MIPGMGLAAKWARRLPDKIAKVSRTNRAKTMNGLDHCLR